MGDEVPLDTHEFRRWREEADRALSAARVQAAADLHNWACFAAEQAAQLAVKALLHGMGKGPWGHDLVRLADMVGAARIAVSEETKGTFRRLGRHYIPARYPDAHAEGPPGTHYGEGDAREAIADAEAVFEFVDRTWEALGV